MLNRVILNPLYALMQGITENITAVPQFLKLRIGYEPEAAFNSQLKKIKAAGFDAIIINENGQLIIKTEAPIKISGLYVSFLHFN